jgi:hypothetical protein
MHTVCFSFYIPAQAKASNKLKHHCDNSRSCLQNTTRSTSTCMYLPLHQSCKEEELIHTSSSYDVSYRRLLSLVALFHGQKPNRLRSKFVALRRDLLRKSYFIIEHFDHLYLVAPTSIPYLWGPFNKHSGQQRIR